MQGNTGGEDGSALGFANIRPRSAIHFSLNCANQLAVGAVTISSFLQRRFRGQLQGFGIVDFFRIRVSSAFGVTAGPASHATLNHAHLVLPAIWASWSAGALA